MGDVREFDLPVGRGELLAERYLIGELLGAGGMGVVVAAEDRKLRRKVAVKFLPTSLREDSESVARFEREALAVAQIRSEHVVSVTDVSTSGPTLYLVMEFLEGQDLAHLVRARGSIPPAEAVGYVLQACEAIAEAHSLGIIHRDLKPANLFLSKRRDGSPLIKVLDFGISKQRADQDGGKNSDLPVATLTSTMAVMGSPRYMSPEQLRSTKNVDARTDIWSLGVILHELVTGRPLYKAESLIDQIAMIAADPPTPLRQIVPNAPVLLEETVLGCLEKDPEKRPRSIAVLAQRLAPLSPRWAAVSVERILGSAQQIHAPTTTVAISSPSPDVLAAPGGTTTSQLSGELDRREHTRTLQKSVGYLAGDHASRRETSARLTLRRIAVGFGALSVVGGLSVLFIRSPGKRAAGDSSSASASVPATTSIGPGGSPVAPPPAAVRAEREEAPPPHRAAPHEEPTIPFQAEGHSGQPAGESPQSVPHQVRQTTVKEQAAAVHGSGLRSAAETSHNENARNKGTVPARSPKRPPLGDGDQESGVRPLRAATPAAVEDPYGARF